MVLALLHNSCALLMSLFFSPVSFLMCKLGAIMLEWPCYLNRVGAPPMVLWCYWKSLQQGTKGACIPDFLGLGRVGARALGRCMVGCRHLWPLGEEVGIGMNQKWGFEGSRPSLGHEWGRQGFLVR